MGDAVRLEGDWVDLVNNLVWVLAGHDIYVTGASLSNLLSDYNLLHRGDDSNAHVAFAAGAVRDTLADWQTATGRDANSLAGDPLFVDLDGADNVLGYRGGADPYDGGSDDNFYRVKHSPAIDRGNAWLAPTTDIDGHARVDDPATPNLGSPDYTESSAAPVVFTLTPPAVGTAMGWQADDAVWTLTLPFAFPLYGTNYTSVEVSSNGRLHFAGPDPASSGDNSTPVLLNNRRIAPLWDDLRTDGAGDDISVDTATAGQVTICWNATNKADGSDVNAAVTLFSDGRFRFDYGPGNRGVTPTIGVSSGDGQTYDLSSYNGQSDLHYAKSLMQRPVAAGAYLPVILPDNEFQAVGTAQNWKADNNAWTLALPFAFPFYDGSYTSVQVSSNGFLQFAGPDWAGQYWNSTSNLARNRRIAPLWDDLTTEYYSDDIYVDTSRSGEVTIRWEATTYDDVQTAVTLYADGRIRLHYGAENTYLTPTVGVSAGDNLNYTLVAGYDGEATLCRRHSVELQRVGSPHFAESPAGGFGVFNPPGAAKGWHDSWLWRTYTLPWSFPFYDKTYSSLYVTSGGFLEFGSSGSLVENSLQELLRDSRHRAAVGRFPARRSGGRCVHRHVGP